MESDALFVGIGNVLEAKGVVLEVVDGMAVGHTEIDQHGRGYKASPVEVVLRVPPDVVLTESVPQQMVVRGQVLAELPAGAVPPLRRGKRGGVEISL